MSQPRVRSATQWCGRGRPAAPSEMPSEVARAAISRPRVSVAMLRLRPAIFLPASYPWLVAEALVEV